MSRAGLAGPGHLRLSVVVSALRRAGLVTTPRRKPNWQLIIALAFLIGVPLLAALIAVVTHQ